MEEKNPVRSFGPAKGINPSKYFDRIRFRDVAGLLGAVAVLLFAVGVSSVSYKLHKEGANATGDHIRVEENSELKYFLTVKEDGVDSLGRQSSDDITANISGKTTTISDVIPEGLEFKGFVATDDGTIGAKTRDDSATACSGRVIDDTNESKVDAGTWDANHTKYYYHGLHYDVATRTVSFKTENIQAGCELTVGIVTQTPELGDRKRVDFYNTARINRGSTDISSNTVHAWMMGMEYAQTYDVTYAYTGTVPDNAPSAPATQAYAEGASVGVEPSPNVDGYQFSGWQTSDVAVSSGSFTMPASTVAFTGSFTAKPSATKYNVTYVIDGDAPADYVAPKTKQYEAGQTVTLDSLSQNAKIDDWSFDGWTSENVELSDRGFTMPARNVEIHGSFTQDTYKVTYAFEGETLPPNANTLLPAVQEYPAGTKVTLADNPTADGYAFTGWYQADTFTMPAEDVTIYGEWMLQRGTFTPEISIKLAGEQKKYREGDAVVFEISVKNPASYPITDVQVMEQMEGAYFTENPNYALKNEQFALISEIPAGETKTVYAEYIIPANEDAEFTNTVQLAGAVADGYTLSTDQEYLASIDFQSEYYVAPEPGDEEPGGEEGDDSDDEPGKESGGGTKGETKQGDIVNTLDSITNYGIIGLIGLIGIVISAVLIAKTIKNDQLQGLKATAPKLSGLKNFFNPNTATKGRLTAMAVADVALIAIVAGLILGFPQKATGENTDLATINLMSSDADYNAGEGGAWKLTKSAKWIGDGEARLTIKVDTVKKASDKKRDIVFAVDTSGSMIGNKMTQMKTDMSELVEDFLNDQENQFALVSFESEAKVELGFTNNKESALSAIDGLETGNNTNYYDALTKVEDVLSGYSEDSNRELYVLILTDGLPTVGSPNEVSEYAYLKQAYPYATIGAVQYEMNSEDVFAPVARISDEQYIADMDSLHNTLYDVVARPEVYSSFTVSDLVNSEHFTIADTDSVVASIGNATLTGENDTPKIIWDMSGRLRSGDSAQLTINLRLKEELKRETGEYRTNTSVGATSLIGVNEESETSDDSPILKNSYSVIYDANSPSECTVDNMPDNETRFVFENVEVGSKLPVCQGYNFSGYVVVNDSVIQYNDDFFRMPVEDVTIRAIWTKASIEKTVDGEVYVGAKLYDVIAQKTSGLDTSVDFGNSPLSDGSNGLGVNTYTPSANEQYPIYYYRGNNDNFVYYADNCWKVVRTTETGGVKIVHQGKPRNSLHQCNNLTYSNTSATYNSSHTKAPALVGYMYNLSYIPQYKDTQTQRGLLKSFSGSVASNYWYSDSATYDETTRKWSLDNPYQVDSTDYSNLEGKYTFLKAESAYTSGTVYYVTKPEYDGYSWSFFYFTLSGNTNVETANKKYSYGDGYAENSDGTFNIDDPTTIDLINWTSSYSDVRGKYACANETGVNCESVLYVYDTTKAYIDYMVRTNDYVYANDFSFVDGEYVLDGSTSINVWNTRDNEEMAKLNNAHYTCLNHSGRCTELKYVFYRNGWGSLYYITFKDGKGLNDAVANLHTNTNNSTLKEAIDAWYEDNIKGKEDESLLEDTVFCNDRTIAEGSGWDKDGGDVLKILYFQAYDRLKGGGRPKLDCPNTSDSFTTKSENGNGALTYPIGPLTADEMVLIGQPFNRMSGNHSDFFGFGYSVGRDRLTATPGYYDSYSSGVRIISNNSGITSSTAVNKESVAVPAISLVPEVRVSSGDGTKEYPWELEVPVSQQSISH